MNVTWSKSPQGYAALADLPPRTLDGRPEYLGLGVYLIWPRGGQKMTYVGQGDIADRLAAHRTDHRITKHGSLEHPLLATWSVIPDAFRSGVERFLIESYKPVVETTKPIADPIEVNLPP